MRKNDRVFSIGFGGQSGDGTFDTLKAIEKVQKLERKMECNSLRSKAVIVSDIFDVLITAGATHLLKWTSVSQVKQYVSSGQAAFLLEELQYDRELAKLVVRKCLPKQCSEGFGMGNSGGSLNTFLGPIGRAIGSALDSASSSFVGIGRPAQPSEVVRAVEQIMARVLLQPVDIVNAAKPVRDASRIVRGGAGNEHILTDARRRKLHELIKPVIYWGTPIEKALIFAAQIFRNERSNVEKVMVVISDGEWCWNPSFRVPFPDVSVVCCFVGRSSNIRRRHLFDKAEDDWCDGAKNLFDLSSVVPCQLLPRATILQNGWTFDIDKNSTKLFAHVNDPEQMREICRLGKNIVCNQDCLSDLLGSVSMDIYINQSNSTLSARLQVGGTCYANASATAIHLSLKRILGRDGGYPKFEDIRRELIREHGSNSADTFGVLEKVCPRYRLRCSRISANLVFRALAAKRIVVAKFRLTECEWSVFEIFFQRYPEGILTNQEINTNRRSSSEQTSGHAVVVTSYTSNCLVLMNSWGDQWADKGFFRVEYTDVLGLEFMDVFWTESNLSLRERHYYKTHGSEVARSLVEKLRGLQVQKFKCPTCGVTSPVNRFTGTLSRATCPQCRQTFACSDAGNILALNIYLTSIATTQTVQTASSDLPVCRPSSSKQDLVVDIALNFRLRNDSHGQTSPDLRTCPTDFEEVRLVSVNRRTELSD